MRKWPLIGFLATCGVVVLLAPPVAASTRSCGTIRAQGTRFAVTVTHGRASCATTRHVLSDFFHGKGKVHGPANGPAYKQWWAVDGWACGYGTGGGGCSRSGARIRAQQT